MDKVRLLGLLIALFFVVVNNNVIAEENKLTEESSSAEKSGETTKNPADETIKNNAESVANKTVDNTLPADIIKAEETTKNRQFSASDFYQTTSIFGSSVSHDGTKVLVSSDKSGIYNLYQYPIDGSEPAQLSNSKTSSIFAQSWFPNDGRLLYSADQAGNELNHIYVREVNGNIKDLTPTTTPEGKLKAVFLSWLQNNNSFFIMTNERDNKSFDLYRYTTDGYQRELIYKNSNSYSIGRVSPDGKWLSLTHSVSNADSNIYLVDLTSENKPLKLITEHQGNVSYRSFTFTPDSQQLIYASNAESEFSQAWRFDIATGNKSVFYATNWDVSFVRYSKDGHYCVVGTNQNAKTKVKVINLASKKRFKMPKMPKGTIRGINFSADSSSMVFYINADNSPSNLYSYRIGDDSIKQLSNSLSAVMSVDDLVVSKVKHFKSFDQLKIPGLLYQPKMASNTNKVPALIWVHGGPGGQSTQVYRAAIQHLVNQGYAIFAVNNRGSSGYGKTFFHLDDKKHGEDDLQDIVYGKKYLQSLDWIDGKRIGIIGGSYGGYMTMAALAFTDEFKVGIDIFGVTNWQRTLTSIPPWWESFRKSLYDEMGDPATDGERHKRISPLFHAQNIKSPVLIVQGANDPRVLQVESDEMVSEIRKNNVPVEYVLFSDEGHGFTKKVNRIKASDAYLAFLQKYL
ncbi:MAG: alpha/beta fold hydrolase [Colwellia sp.]|nr:alpha/beta fold hydrolase [Colwellia sp.]